MERFLDLLGPGADFPEHHDGIDARNEPDGLPLPEVQHVLVLDDPLERDKAVVDPRELEQHREQQRNGAVHEERVERVHDGHGVREERDVDGDSDVSLRSRTG